VSARGDEPRRAADHVAKAVSFRIMAGDNFDTGACDFAKFCHCGRRRW